MLMKTACLVACSFLAICVSIVGASTNGCEQLSPNEEAGKFREALKTAESSAGNCGLEQNHLSKLKALAQIEESITNSPYSMTAERTQDLRSFITKVLDAKDDQTLIQGSYVLLEKLSVNAESLGNSPFGKVWKQLSTLKSGPVRVQLLPVGMAETFFRQLLTFTIRVLFVVGVVALLTWRLWPRKGIEVSFEELTAEESKKPILDRVLTQDVQQAFWVPRTELTEGRPGGLDLEPIRDREASGFGNLVPQRPLIPWNELVQSGTPIRVGPVAFDLRQILVFLLSPLRTRRRSSLIGFVHVGEERTVIMAQQVDWKGRQLVGRSWKAERGSQSNRHDMILDLAAQIIVDLRVSEITTNWQSYRHFCRGLNAISTGRLPANPGHCECIETARDEFRTALALDPGNWMARFYLAICLCRCGENGLAVNHFTLLETILKEADLLLPRTNERRKRKNKLKTSIARHLEQYPQCPFLVLYNKAMALSGTLEPSKLEQALGTLRSIIDSMVGKSEDSHVFSNCGSRLRHHDRERFTMLALSATASIMATQSEYQVYQPDAVSKLSGIRCKIDAIINEFDDRCGKIRTEILPTHTLAEATLLNADGRVAMASFEKCSGNDAAECASKAQEWFRRAQTTLPDLVDSYLNLVNLYLRARGLVTDMWRNEAQNELLKLKILAPGNEQAKYLEATLAVQLETPDFESALSLLKELPNKPEAYFSRAEILSDPRFFGHDLNAAVGLWRKGLSLISEPRRTQIQHCFYLCKYSKQHPGDADLLQDVATEAQKKLEGIIGLQPDESAIAHSTVGLQAMQSALAPL
jgi:tetratricopeptide (TPR) repeat protein